MAFLILAVSTIVFLAKANGSGVQRKYYYCEYHRNFPHLSPPSARRRRLHADVCRGSLAVSTYICGFAAMSYFAMLSGQGWTAIAGCRQFFYARYADWAVTVRPRLFLHAPPLPVPCYYSQGVCARWVGTDMTWRDIGLQFVLTTILLGLVAGAEADLIGGAAGSAVVMVFSLYMGSVSVVTTVKWFWFLISLMGLAGAVVHFAQSFKAAADMKGGDGSALYGKVAWIVILSWICYPVIWLFSEGFASFSVSFEVCLQPPWI